jgi:DNA repair exonuclease SbcCD nuclease subunit
MIKFAHISDLQLGCNRFDGRLWEQDFYEAWHDIADRLAARDDISHVLIVGDIFEYASPSTAARYAFEVGLRKLAGKRVLIVSGNHETPRATETMHPLRPYQDWPNVIVAIDEDISVDGFHLTPWHWGQPLDYRQLEPGADLVLAVHAACPVLEAYSREGARDFLPEYGAPYQYVALGDYHAPVQVSPNAWYAGSLEHTSFGEADVPTGGFIVTVDENGYTQERIESEHRPMNNHEITDDYETNLAGVTALIGNQMTQLHRIIFRGVEPLQVNPSMLTAARDAGQFVKIVFQDRPEPPPLVDFGPTTLYDQWHEFVDAAELGPEVAQTGQDILEEAVANEN